MAEARILSLSASATQLPTTNTRDKTRVETPTARRFASKLPERVNRRTAQIHNRLNVKDVRPPIKILLIFTGKQLLALLPNRVSTSFIL